LPEKPTKPPLPLHGLKMACLAGWKQNERLFWHWDINFQIRTRCLGIKHLIYGAKKSIQKALLLIIIED